jgi:hypothetical protein
MCQSCFVGFLSGVLILLSLVVECRGEDDARSDDVLVETNTPAEVAVLEQTQVSGPLEEDGTLSTSTQEQQQDKHHEAELALDFDSTDNTLFGAPVEWTMHFFGISWGVSAPLVLVLFLLVVYDIVKPVHVDKA